MDDGQHTLVAHPAQAAVSGVQSAVTDLLAANLWSLPERDLLELSITLEAARARLDAAVLAVTREVDARGAATATGAASTAAWLTGRLLMHPAAAKAEVALAAALDTELGQTRDALAAGEVIRDQAGAVHAAVRALPAGVDPAPRLRAQTWLLEQAGTFHPGAIAKLSRHLVLTLDPDRGQALERDEARRDAAQELTLVHGADGARRFRGQLGPESGDLVDAALAAVGAPRPAADGTPDPRTPA